MKLVRRKWRNVFGLLIFKRIFLVIGRDLTKAKKRYFSLTPLEVTSRAFRLGNCAVGRIICTRRIIRGKSVLDTLDKWKKMNYPF